MQPIFLTLDEVLEVHRHQIEVYGGSYGIRDHGLLESAIAQPEASFGDEYLSKDLFEMAASYLFHIVQNHPFNDGNKRAGAMCAFSFLGMNDLRVIASSDDFEVLVMSTASGNTLKPPIAEFFRLNSVPYT